MKGKFFFLLLFLTVTILSPLSFQNNFPSRSFASIVSIDVCNGFTQFLSQDSEIPVILEDHGEAFLLNFAGFYKISITPFHPFFLFQKKEKPPEILFYHS